MSWWLPRFAAAFLLLCAFENGFLAQAASAVGAQKRELIVKFRPAGNSQERDRALRNATALREIGSGLSRQTTRQAEAAPTLVVSLPDDVPLASEMARLASIPAVEYVEPNYPIKILATAGPVIPNDFEFSQMYAL